MVKVAQKQYKVIIMNMLSFLILQSTVDEIDEK